MPKILNCNNLHHGEPHRLIKSFSGRDEALVYNYGMATYIDEAFWREALSKPTWYLLLKNDFARLERLAEKETDYTRRKRIKDEAYSLVEEAVREKRLPTADHGDDFDSERKAIDTIVIHHTKNKPGMTLERLNAIQLLRVYGEHYASAMGPEQKQPVWSGHFYNEQQVFWGYHWLVRANGTSERILRDDYIGWHAGNWDINTRSIGICIDDDLSDKEPSAVVIQAVADIITQHYTDTRAPEVLGHCEVNEHTACPGYLFVESWKRKLTTQLQ